MIFFGLGNRTQYRVILGGGTFGAADRQNGAEKMGERRGGGCGLQYFSDSVSGFHECGIGFTVRGFGFPGGDMLYFFFFFWGGGLD